MFVRWPNGEFGEARDVAQLTHVQDLLPTLIELCDLERIDLAPEFDGVSLAGLLLGHTEPFPDRMLVVNYSRMPFETTRPSTDHNGMPRREGAAVMWRRWRLLEDRMLFNLDIDPMQQDNVIDQHPEVVAAMRAHLDVWWDGVKERVNEPSRVVIGSEAENPMMLTACEWFDVFIDQQRQVRVADEKVGVWHLEVDQPGEYSIELRRYPREASLAINAGVDATPVTDGRLAEGRELNIASARLQIGEFDEVVVIDSDAESVTFSVPLTPGPIELMTVFLDTDGKEICGAYYAYVERR